MRTIDFKSLPYCYTDRHFKVASVCFSDDELDSVYAQVKAMYNQAHYSDMPTEPGWYVTQDGESLLSFDGDEWHIHCINGLTPLFADGDSATMDWSVVKRTFDDNSFPLVPINLEDIARGTDVR